MAQIFKGRVFNSSPYPSAEVNYEYTRDGANMKYHFWGKVYLENKSGWYYNNIRLKLYLNGSDIYTKNCKSSSKGWSISFDSGWHTVSNKTSGTTPFYFTAKDTQDASLCNYTSRTYQLDVSPAYFTSTPTFTLTSRTETTATFSWSTPQTCSTVQYKINDGSWVDVVGDANSTSGSFTVSGLSANTYYTIYGDFKRRDSGLWAQTKPSQGVSTYAYPYLSSVPEFTVGNELKIGVYNPLGRSCTIYIIGDDGIEILGGTFSGTSISPFNSDSWKNNWYKSLPKKKQGTYKARLVCSTGNVNQTSAAVKYYLNTSDSEFNPTFPADNIISIANTLHTDISGANKFIKNHNKLTGTIKPMVGKRFADITTGYYNISASGLTTVKKNYSSSNIAFELGNMNSDIFNVTAVDGRGFTTTRSKTIDLVDYNNPGVTTSKITRQNGIGTKAVLAFTGVYTNWTGLLKTNSIQSIRYKIGSSGTWKSLPSNATLTSSNGVWTLNAILDDTFATTSQYDLYLEIKDLLETVVVGSYTISTADAFIWKDLFNKYFGIRKKPTKTLDVAGDIGSDGDIYSRGNCQQQSKYDLNLSSLSTSNFYPVTFEGLDHILDCEIMSSGLEGSAKYNQNHIHYRLLSRGWSDTPTFFTILEYGVYDGNELTIGCIGKGDGNTYNSVVWLRGGMNYKIWANQKPTLHTSDWDNNSANNGSKFTVGTNLYGGSNVRTSILFTPQSTIKQGAYFNRGIKISVDSIYPVGSIYISVNNTNPGTLFGGTWEQIKDVFLYATQSTSGNTGGSKNHTHSLDTNTAIGAIRLNDGGSIDYAETTVSANITTNYSITGTGGKGSSDRRTNHYAMKLYGNTSSSSNMPPYLEVYMWKRTA